MEARFGISPDAFAPYLLLKKKKAWYMLRNGPHLERADHLQISRAGLKAFQQAGAHVKPSTRLIQMIGGLATRGIIRIDLSELRTLLEGKTLISRQELENGYVILTLKEKQILGMGLLLDDTIRSQIPKGEIKAAMITGIPGCLDAGP